MTSNTNSERARLRRPWGAPTCWRFGTKAVPRHRTPRRRPSGSVKRLLALRALEDLVADFRAVGDCKNAGFLTLTPILEQHRPVRCEGLLNRAVIKEFSRVFHRNTARIAFLVLEPQHTKRSGADVVTGLSFFLISQIYDVKLESFLLIFPDKRQS